MRELFVVKDVAYAAKQGGGTVSGINEVNLLADGAIAIFTDAGALQAVGSAIAATVTKLYFAKGNGTTATEASQLSELVIRKTCNSLQTQTYQTPVAQITYIGYDQAVAKSTGALILGVEYAVTTASGASGDYRAGTVGLLTAVSGTLAKGTVLAADTQTVLGDVFKCTTAGIPDGWDSGVLTPTASTNLINLPSTLPPGDELVVRFITYSNQEGVVYTPDRAVDPTKKVTAVYTIKTGDTEASAVAGLVAEINNLTKAPCTALTVGTTYLGIKLTAKTAGIGFSATCSGILQSADMTKDGRGASLINLIGNGSSAHISYIEDQYSTEQGNTNKIYLANKFFNKASDIVAGATYDLYTTSFVVGRSNSMGGGVYDTATKCISIAILSSVSTFEKTNFLARLAEIKL